MVTQTQANVVYASRTKLLELGYKIAQTRNLKKVSDKIKQASKIVYWLQALSYDQYLSFEQREQIWKCLISIADLNQIPVAPLVSNPGVTINYGGGSTVINNITYETATPFQNTDIDTGTETVDSFSVAASRGAIWFYNIYKGSNQRTGVITSGWLSGGSSISTSEDSVSDIGDTSDVSIDVDLDSGSIRLRVTAASDDWVINGLRFLITA